MAIGGAFSCLSFVIQAHIGTLYPAHKYVFGAVAYGAGGAAARATDAAPAGHASIRRHERLGGIVLGAINAVSMPLTLVTIR